MKRSILLFVSLLFQFVSAQLYFPPNNSTVWETMSPQDLGWCPNKIDSLYQFLGDNHTKAFIVLKDGKIVLEQYFNGHSATANWYWASAGKTITALLIGVAQQEGHLQITQPTSTYLGAGWTSLTPQQESQITVWHQLTMTTGLHDGLGNLDCTTPSCLQFLASPGARWSYHNAPYTLLTNVIEQATNTTLNLYTTQKLRVPTGMDGFFFNQGDYNQVFLSTARSMARFGLLMLNNGIWNTTPILTQSSYVNAMLNTSQTLNLSYGYLWWLNGKSSFMVPQLQNVFNGSIFPNAPNDMVAALGKNGQFINVVPSQNLVLIRMGDNPDDALVPFLYNDQIWAYMNELECNTMSNISVKEKQLLLYPNPVHELIHIHMEQTSDPIRFEIHNMQGQLMLTGVTNGSIPVGAFPKGLYVLRIQDHEGIKTACFVKN